MRKYLLAMLATVVVLVLVYAASNDNAANYKVGALNESRIDWVKYDIGLRQAAEDGKYVIAYFWRDG